MAKEKPNSELEEKIMVAIIKNGVEIMVARPYIRASDLLNLVELEKTIAKYMHTNDSFYLQ